MHRIPIPRHYSSILIIPRKQKDEEFLVAGRGAERAGQGKRNPSVRVETLRQAYAKVQSYHARGACESHFYPVILKVGEKSLVSTLVRLFDEIRTYFERN